MKKSFVILSLVALLSITACGKKEKSSLKWLPQATSKEEFQQNFVSSCLAGSKEYLLKKKVDEGKITDAVLQNGCDCTLRTLNTELSEMEWTDLINRLSVNKQPKKDLKKHLRTIHSTCYATALPGE